jgi:hypothetical protein
MNKEHEILSDIIVWMKYAKFIPELNRRETWEELVTRNMNMHIEKFPQLEGMIQSHYRLVFEKKVLPSMRSLQFAGKPIEVNNTRLFNCSYLHIDDYRAFGETMFLLLSGTGVGYSVQKHHVEKLPAVSRATKNHRYLIGDSIEGWADAIKVLVKSYFGLSTWKPSFDYRAIRAKGERLITSGGVAPGPEPLKICLTHVESIFERKADGEKLTSLECHDILCHIANAVLAGGIRRSAMISLFDKDDEEMLTCKFGKWYETNPQRGRANNSAVLLRGNICPTSETIGKEQFLELWKKVELSNSGEPGFYFTDNKELGTNPCCFTGDMGVLTPSGYQTFEDLAKDGTSQFVNVNGELVDGTVWETGRKPTVSVKLASGKKIKCTSDHRFMLTNGSECEAKDLKGQRVMPFFTVNKEINKFVKWGFIQGDGATSRLASDTHKGLEVYFGEKDAEVAEIFGFSSTGLQYISGMNEELIAFGFSSNTLPTRGLPSGFASHNESIQKSFLKGMYSANGSVIKTSRIAYKTTSKSLASGLVKVLLSFGLNPYITTNKAKTVEFSNGSYECKESYDVNIGRIEDIIWFASNIGFVQGYKNEALVNLIKKRAPMVVSVTDGIMETVYDFSLDDDTHWGVVEGVIAHNCEISLNSFQFCNLVEINASDIKDQQDLIDRTIAAAFIGTIQASYTDFHYLRPQWKKVTEREALLGIGMTGIASGAVLKLDLESAAQEAIEANRAFAKLIGIKPAARVTCVKPSGTSSLVLGTSSGVHAWHDQYYIRRIRIGKNEALYTYLSIYHPNMIEDDALNSNQVVFSVPVAAPEGAITRSSESAIDFLERVKFLHGAWIKPGHNFGDNTHNVSATVTVKANEWEDVGEWLWNNQDHYNGLSFLPEDLGSYPQTPFETITKDKYEELIRDVHSLDITKVVEMSDNTNLNDQHACSGGNCEI